MKIKDEVLEYLKTRSPHMGKTPTEIGIALGYSYTRASSAVTQPLKQLIKQGLVRREVRSPGRILYYLTNS